MIISWRAKACISLINLLQAVDVQITFHVKEKLKVLLNKLYKEYFFVEIVITYIFFKVMNFRSNHLSGISDHLAMEESWLKDRLVKSSRALGVSTLTSDRIPEFFWFRFFVDCFVGTTYDNEGKDEFKNFLEKIITFDPKKH